MKTWLNFFFLAFISLCSKQVFAQKEYHYALGLKPLNFSNISFTEKGEFIFGHYVGIEFETLISKNKKLSFVLPITYGDLKTYLITDINAEGRDCYISPGLKYYFKDFNADKSLAMSTFLLLGHRDYRNNPKIRRFSSSGYFSGLLVDGHFLKRTKRNWFLNVELGLGIRAYNATNEASYFDYVAQSIIVEKTNGIRLDGICNASFGFQYRF